MACTFANALNDSCKCLGTTEVCGADSYCYEGQCTAENKCGDGLCTTACACVNETGKVAQKCEGANKYCKNGKVMTLCTADSLAAEECACTIGDDGVCMGFCADGNCYGYGSCLFNDSNQDSCVCASQGKKVGVFKKTKSTVCRSTGKLEAVPGGCEDSMKPDAVCKCKSDGNNCASGSVCRMSGCELDKCNNWACDCSCAGDSKNAVYCYSSHMSQCVDGKIVPLAGKQMCTDQHDPLSYCQCSTKTATLCASAGKCADGDCYSAYTPTCSVNASTARTCLCKYTGKVVTVAKTGDICNTGGTVTKICTNGAPIQKDACFCGSKDGRKCKKGDVCIGGKCYGEADNATAKYCTDSNVCTTACACTDFSFSEAALCFGAFQKCENSALVTLECTDEAKKADACKCSALTETACPSGSVCVNEICYGPSEAEKICSTTDYCSNACACIANSDTGKAATLCDGEKQYCDSGVIKNVCTDKSINSENCECKKGDSAACASQNVCISEKCYGAGNDTTGAFCVEDTACSTACACKSEISKTAEICQGATKYCNGGAVKDICADKSINQAACRCKASDSADCASQNVCLSDSCYGSGAGVTGAFCTSGQVCSAACACKSQGGTTVELCSGAFQKCENNAVVTLKCSEDAKKADACKCSDGAENACPSDSVCSSEVCYGPGEDKGICESDGFCSTACACIASSHIAKAAAVCSGEKQYCDSGVIKNVCTDKSINSQSCECTKGDATACSKDNVCIDEKCYGSGSGLEGAFCTDGQMCGTTCACKAADGKTAAVCDGSSKFCGSGEVRDLCADKTVNGSSCYCKSGDATECAASNVCLDSQCFGTGAPNGDFCSVTAACGEGCACKSADGKTAEKCSGQNYYCVEGAIVLKCPAGQGKEDNECRACDTNCLECAEKRSICARCADKLKLEGGKCEKGGLGAGAIVGIVIAVVVVLSAIIIGVFFFLKHRKQEEKKVDYQEKEEDQVQVAAE